MNLRAEEIALHQKFLEAMSRLQAAQADERVPRGL
jgi:hypothetical protein